VLQNLGISAELDSEADWQVLKKHEFGVLGWDCEEGLRFECDISNIPDLVKFVREYRLRWLVPFVWDATPTRRGWAHFQCYLAMRVEDEPRPWRRC